MGVTMFTYFAILNESYFPLFIMETPECIQKIEMLA